MPHAHSIVAGGLQPESPFDQLSSPLPPHAHAVSYAPFDSLLPRLAALVHHDGIDTTARTLAARLPQPVLSFAHDQFDNPTRLVKCGVALRLTARSSVRRWAQTLERLRSDASIAAACQRHASLMADDRDAADRIAAQIEGLQPNCSLQTLSACIALLRVQYRSRPRPCIDPVSIPLMHRRVVHGVLATCRLPHQRRRALAQ